MEGSIAGLNCSGSMAPETYVYNGRNLNVRNAGRYPAACFEGPDHTTWQQEVSVDLAKNWWSCGIEIDANGDGKPDTSTTLISNPITFRGRKAINLSAFPVDQNHPSINPKDPNPFAGGLAIALEKDGRYEFASHLEVWVFAETAGTVIFELHDQDSLARKPQCSNWDTNPPGPKGCYVGGSENDPRNFYFPTNGDEFIVKVLLNPDGKWHRLLIPLRDLVDWNQSRGEKPGAPDFIPGVTEKIGDGQLNPKEYEEYTLQITLVGADYKTPIKVNIGQTVRFLSSMKSLDD